MAIRPAHFEISASPGDQVKATVYFWNGTDIELPVHMESEDIRPQDEEGHVAGGAEDAVNSLKSWVKPVYSDVVVFPKQEIALDFTIDVPPNADPGSHWGGVVVQTAPVFTGGGAAIQSRVGTIVLLRVAGEAKEKLTLESMSMPRFAESPPIALEARFKNEGTVHEALPEVLKCGICSDGLWRQEHCRCRMFGRATCAKLPRPSAMGYGWDGIRCFSARRTEMPGRCLWRARLSGSCHGGRRDGSFLSVLVSSLL